MIFEFSPASSLKIANGLFHTDFFKVLYHLMLGFGLGPLISISQIMLDKRNNITKISQIPQ